MKLSDWAKAQGLTYQTAWRYHKSGKMPEGITTVQLPNGTILVNEGLQVNVAKDLTQRVERLEQEVAKLKGGE